MASVSWTALDGNWFDGSNWSTGTVPNGNDDATFGGSGYTVAITAALAIHSIQSGEVGFAIVAPAGRIKVAGDVSTNGTIDVDNSGTGGTTLLIGGTFSGPVSSVPNVVIGNSGITSETLVKVGALAGAGNFTIAGGSARAVLDIASGSDTLNGTYGLSGRALLEVAGPIRTISGTPHHGFSTLAISGTHAYVALHGQTTTNSALTRLSRVDGFLRIGDGADVTSEASVVDTGRIAVGNGGHLTVRALRSSAVFPGQVRVGSETKTSVVDIASAAPSTLVGDYELTDSALVDYAGGGEITTIRSRSRVYFYGAHAHLASGTQTSTNSALTQLTENDGGLGVTAGASVTVDVTFTNAAGAQAGSSLGGRLAFLGDVTDAGAFGTDGGGVIDVSGSFHQEGTGNLYAIYGGIIRIAGTLTNAGLVSIGTYHSDRHPFPSADTISVGGLDNTGTVDLLGTDSPSVLIDHQAGPLTLTGHYSISSASLLETSRAGVVAIAAGAMLSLTGPDTRVAYASDLSTSSALNGLRSNAGEFDLDHATVTLAKAFDNSGTLDLSGAANLTLGGPSSDSGSVVVGQGLLTLADTLAVSGALTFEDGAIAGGTVAGGGTVVVKDSYFATFVGTTIAAGTTVTAGEASTVFLDNTTIAGFLTGAGASSLAFEESGPQDLTHISGFDSIALSSNGANSMALTDGNFAGADGPITVKDGNSGTVVDGSALSADDAIVVESGNGTDRLIGGAGADTFAAATKTTMTGNGGADTFVLQHAGVTADRITDFVSGIDRLSFSDAAFDLGVDEGLGTASPQALAASLFSANTDGTFATAANRFAYDSATGALFYDADGRGGASAQHTIVTLTGHPTIGAADLFFQQ